MLPSVAAMRRAISGLGSWPSSLTLCAGRLGMLFSACLISGSRCRPVRCSKLWNPCLLAPWILSLGQLRTGRGYTASRIGRCRLRGSRTYSSPCASSCIPSSCNAKPHLAYVRLSQSIARIRYLRSPRLLICGKCGSNGPTPWATQVHLIGRLHLANRMQLSHWHAWQPCWGIRM